MDVPISVREVRKTFRGHLGIGSTVAVDGLTFEVRRGEIFGLLGPNGAGKTTTLKMLIGLLRPDAGEVRLFGRPPTQTQARRRLGFLPEQPYFYEYLTAEEFLTFYARLQGVPAADRAARVGRALERVGLGDRGGTPLRKCSKGMLQRVGLAQAIQHDPDLVILDEPMSGLDPIGRREVRDLILELRAAGRTVLFSSHILSDAELLCDRVAIVFRGRARAIGRLDELVPPEARWYEVEIEGGVPEILGTERVASSGRETLLRVPDAKDLPRVLAAAEAAGARVVSVFPRRRTLEDLFLEEIGRARAEEARP
jgi:ABC-2 type transport system ATP-binding protein